MGNAPSARAMQLPNHHSMPTIPLIHPSFWDNTGIRWKGAPYATHGIIENPIQAFGSPPVDLRTDDVASLNFEQHVFERLCGMIRTRAYQLNGNRYPSDKSFYKQYSIQLGDHTDWDAETLHNIRHIIERLRFQCQSPTSNAHHNRQTPPVEWKGDAHHATCVIHHLPVHPDHILHLSGNHGPYQIDPRAQDNGIVKFMGDLYKFEFNEFQKQKKRDPSLTLENVHFQYDDPRVHPGPLTTIQHMWDQMWDVANIQTTHATHWGGDHSRASLRLEHDDNSGSRVSHASSADTHEWTAQGPHANSWNRSPSSTPLQIEYNGQHASRASNAFSDASDASAKLDSPPQWSPRSSTQRFSAVSIASHPFSYATHQQAGSQYPPPQDFSNAQNASPQHAAQFNPHQSQKWDHLFGDGMQFRNSARPASLPASLHGGHTDNDWGNRAVIHHRSLPNGNQIEFVHA
jgi:hypothetical protein